MKRALLLALIPAFAFAGLGGTCKPKVVLVQEVVSVPGFQEIHTPGSGDAAEFATPAKVATLLGPNPDLNTVTYVRTYLNDGSTPSVIIILIPGFLGGGTTLDPLARDMVSKFNGTIEVWAVDRRPNQLEDRLGALHASDGAAAAANDAEKFTAVTEGIHFYFPDSDLAPTGNFPGPEDLDINLNGVLDGQLPLEDPLDPPNTRGPQILTQDEARWFAYWGLDTYFRDWKILVDAARGIVGNTGLVLMGGHSQGTGWSSIFAAYDFDPDPGNVVAGYSLIDGLILLEGGGSGAGAGVTKAVYDATVTDLATPGGADVYLSNFSGIPLQDLGQAAEASAVAGVELPSEPSVIQRTPPFGTPPVSFLISAPSTNRSVTGFFLDDDFSAIGAFRGSFGFSDNGPNTESGGFYIASPATDGSGLRNWLDFDDPSLPSIFDMPPCDPLGAAGSDPTSVGCAIKEVDPGDPSRGIEAEVTSIVTFLQTQFGKANGFEWYFASGRPNLDFSFGNDSSALVAENLAVTPGDEGPLVITQNANVDIPVITFGGSNGLTPTPASWNTYLGSIASTDTETHILEGYAHLDVVSAKDNGVVPPLTEWINRLHQQKLLDNF